jgi:DNA repair exonuclease SbcCD ATPase subunit
MQEQAEIATSIQLEASLAAMKAKNDDALKEMLQLEQELAAITSENETLNRFKGFGQEQCFSAKAESYKINGEKQKAKQLLRDVDQSIAYWKDVLKLTDASVKTSDEHVAALYDSPWVVQKCEVSFCLLVIFVITTFYRQKLKLAK